MHAREGADLDGVRSDLLSPEQKRRVWAHIRDHDPELSAFLTSPDATAIRERLNQQFPGSCVPVIPWTTLRASLSLEDLRHLRASSNPSTRSRS